MKNPITTTLFIASILLSACLGPKAQAETTNNTAIEGEDPATYYSLFQYRKTGTCASKDMYFHFLSSRLINKIGVNEVGQDIVIEVNVYLLNGTDFVAYYKENDVLGYTELGYIYDVSRRQTIKGKYSVVGTKLVLTGLGEATAISYNRQRAIELVGSENIISSGFKGVTLTMGMSVSNYMPVGELDPCEHP